MKKTAFVVLVVTLALLIFAGSALAKQFVPSGFDLYILDGAGGDQVAGDPFHVSHGWATQPTEYEYPPAQFYAELSLDEEQLEADYLDRYVAELDGVYPTLYRVWYWDFPEGLTAGEHTFRIAYYAPCIAVLEGSFEYVVDECPSPNAPTLAADRVGIFTFVEP